MDHLELPEVDDLSAEIDWDTFFTFEPEDMNLLSDDARVTPSLIDEIENILMNDDDQEADAGEGVNPEFFSQAWANVLSDSPGTVSGEVVDCLSEKDSESSGQENGEREEKKDDPAEVANDSDSADDPIAKKRQRQLRNRDAAVRSRERKKSYVKDMEIKSKYLEGECLRMGRILQCLIAENQALRLCMQNKAHGASMSKQESAVLLMESLLLGSLLWFLGIMCLFTLPMPLILVAQNTAEKDQEGRALKGARNETFRSFGTLCSFTMTRRCKASKTKMRGSSMDVLLELDPPDLHMRLIRCSPGGYQFVDFSV